MSVLEFGKEQLRDLLVLMDVKCAEIIQQNDKGIYPDDKTQEMLALCYRFRINAFDDIALIDSGETLSPANIKAYLKLVNYFDETYKILKKNKLTHSDKQDKQDKQNKPKYLN